MIGFAVTSMVIGIIGIGGSTFATFRGLISSWWVIIPSLVFSVGMIALVMEGVK